MSTNCTPLTTRPSSTSRQGMIRFAGTGPQYVTPGSAQVAGAHAHVALREVLIRGSREGHDVKQPGRVPARRRERDVLNVDRKSPGWAASAPCNKLDRRRTGQDPEPLDQRTVGGACKLSGWQTR